MHGTVKIEIRDSLGRVTHSEERTLRSPLKAFIQILLMRMGAADVLLAKDTGGTDRTLEQADTSNMMTAVGTINDDTIGIVVGTNSGGIGAIGTTVAIDDYALKNQIAHGGGASQLSHAAQTNPSDVTTIDPKVEFKIVRVFTNSSGGEITVSEMGVYAQQECTGAVTGVFCIVRDIVTAVAISNGSTATAIYTFRITE